MKINRLSRSARLLATCATVLIILQYTPEQYVYADTPSFVTHERAAIVTIYSGNAESGQTGMQEGFFADKNGIIAVPYSTISGNSRVNGSPLFVRTADGSYLQIDQVVAVDRQKGLALLKVNLSDSPAAKLSPDFSPVSGEIVFIPVSKPGIKNAFIEGKTVVLPDGKRSVVFSQPVPPGIGGSLIYDSEGHVIGMIASKQESGNAVYRLISAKEIAALLAEYEKSVPQLRDTTGPEEQAGPDQAELENELEKAKSLVEQDPGNAKAYVLLGWAYSKLGMYADAIDAYKDAANLRPGSAGIYNNIGVIYGRNMGMYDKAIVEFRKALKLKPDYDEARFNLAVAYVFSDDQDSALKEYRELKKRDPERALKLFDLIYERQKEEDSAPDPGEATE